jgi:hypothetical protein
MSIRVAVRGSGSGSSSTRQSYPSHLAATFEEGFAFDDGLALDAGFALGDGFALDEGFALDDGFPLEAGAPRLAVAAGLDRGFATGFFAVGPPVNAYDR